MMKKALAVTCAALLLAACSDSEKPSNALFEKTINQFSAEDKICLPVVINVQNPRTRDTFSQIPVGQPEIQVALIDSKGNRINQTALAQLDLLEDEDYYDKSKTKMLPSPKSTSTVDVAVYTLTDKGKEQSRAVPKAMPHFCIGHQKVEKINWYTEPSPSNGMTVSRVSYEARFVPEEWLEKLLKEGGGNGKLPVDEVRSETTSLVKTSEGWKDSRELK
ncbi:hypothetical protein [Neisseria perflava]|uniref:hypothetical protein n=1 Tax=Neisseria perflava TaxID=33053 RepID=UPI0020A2091F|nr:hypothetical protein [Neisseria perflava]MCP1660429.1 hypothetical protein [Neisseria perflava]MCP1772111.1 hypothetical protein [Neisseria perflava]